MGLRIGGAQLQALQERRFSFVEAALLVQRPRQHEARFRRRESQGKRTPRGALRFGRVTKIALGRGEVVPRDGVAGIRSHLRPKARRVGRAVARHR